MRSFILRIFFEKIKEPVEVFAYLLTVCNRKHTVGSKGVDK